MFVSHAEVQLRFTENHYAMFVWLVVHLRAVPTYINVLIAELDLINPYSGKMKSLFSK